VKIKRVYNEIGTELRQARSEETWTVLNFNAFTVLSNAELADSNLFMATGYSIYRKLEDETEYINWLRSELSDIQKNFMLNDGEVDLRYVLIDYISVMVRSIIMVDRNSLHRLRAHCRTAYGGMAKKQLYFTEVTNLGICMYEAYWTAFNLNKIKKRVEKWR